MHCNEVVLKKGGDIERGKSIRRNLGRNPIVQPSAFSTSSFLKLLGKWQFFTPRSVKMWSPGNAQLLLWLILYPSPAEKLRNSSLSLEMRKDVGKSPATSCKTLTSYDTPRHIVTSIQPCTLQTIAEALIYLHNPTAMIHNATDPIATRVRVAVPQQQILFPSPLRRPFQV